MKHPEKQPRTVLVAVASGVERRSLQRILPSSRWNLRFAPSFQEAKAALHSSSISVVICNAGLEGGHSWKDLLKVAQAMDAPAQLIVADRLADEALWAEVLNLGGYDLLMTPFADQEVLHVVPMAWGARERELERGLPRTKPAKSVEFQSLTQERGMAAGAA